MINKRTKRSLTEDTEVSVDKYQQLLTDFCNENKGAFEKKDGYYLYTVDVDYRDELDARNIADIMKSDSPKDAFYQLIDESYNYFYQEEEYILDEFNKYLSEHDYEEIDMDIWQEIRDIIVIEPDYSHFLQQKMRCLITVDSGDANYDFSLNPSYYSGYTFDDDDADNESASIVWLAKQQGYTYEQVKEVLDNSIKVKDKFLESIRVEVENVTSSMNALVFLVTATLDEIFTWKQNKMDIEVSQNAMCGLFDSWQGGGSVLAIELVKPVVIPYANVWDFAPDINEAVRGQYSVSDVYGMSSLAYRGTVKLVGAGAPKTESKKIDRVVGATAEKEAQGENYIESFVVYDEEGNEIEDFADEYEAIEFAKDNGGYKVTKYIDYEDSRGNILNVYDAALETVWVRESVQPKKKASKTMNESLNKKATTKKKINITESLNNIDKSTNNKYDLLTAYQCHDISEGFTKGLAERLAKNTPAKALYEYLMGSDDPTELFSDFLKTIEFRLVRYPDGYGLVDMQGANLGDIESERYGTATQIADRLDMYLDDYFFDDYYNELRDYGVDTTNIPLETLDDFVALGNNKELQSKYPEFYKDHEFKIVDMLANHTDEVKLSKIAAENK